MRGETQCCTSKLISDCPRTKSNRTVVFMNSTSGSEGRHSAGISQ